MAGPKMSFTAEPSIVDPSNRGHNRKPLYKGRFLRFTFPNTCSTSKEDNLSTKTKWLPMCPLLRGSTVFVGSTDKSFLYYYFY